VQLLPMHHRFQLSVFTSCTHGGFWFGGAFGCYSIMPTYWKLQLKRQKNCSGLFIGKCVNSGAGDFSTLLQSSPKDFSSLRFIHLPTRERQAPKPHNCRMALLSSSDVPWISIDSMQQGSALLKFGRSGAPHFRWVVSFQLKHASHQGV